MTVGKKLWVMGPFGDWIEPPFGDEVDPDLRSLNVRTASGWKTAYPQHSNFDAPDSDLYVRRPGNTVQFNTFGGTRANWLRLMYLKDRNDPNWRIEFTNAVPTGVASFYEQRYYNDATFTEVLQRSSTDGTVASSGEMNQVNRNFGHDPSTQTTYAVGLADIAAFSTMLATLYPTRTMENLGWYYPITFMGVRRVELRIRVTYTIYHTWFDNRTWSSGTYPVPEIFASPVMGASIITGSITTETVGDDPYGVRAPASVTENPGTPLDSQIGLSTTIQPYSTINGNEGYKMTLSRTFFRVFSDNDDYVAFGAKCDDIYPAGQDTLDPNPGTLNSKPDTPYPFTSAAQVSVQVVSMRVHYAMPGYNTPSAMWATE